MGYREEFPEYPVESMPTLPDGWTDRSWKNEPVPCFIHEATGIILWIDFPPEMTAEMEDVDCERFFAQRCLEKHPEAGWQMNELADLFATDDWKDAEIQLDECIDKISNERQPITDMIEKTFCFQRPRDADEAAQYGWSNGKGDCLLIRNLETGEIIGSVASGDVFDVNGNHFAEND
jgi:hypothetical protein